MLIVSVVLTTLALLFAPVSEASAFKGVEPNSWNWPVNQWGDASGLGTQRIALDPVQDIDYYSNAKLDPVVAAAGSNPILALSGHGSPPANFDTYAQRAAEIAVRYPGVRIQVWNEPNTARFWGTDNDATGYATLLRKTYDAVKAVSPSTEIITGSASPTAGHLEYTQAVLSMAPADSVGVHPYSTNPYWSEQIVRDYHNITNKPLVITEFGWGTDCSPAAAWCYDEATQAAYMKEALDRYYALGYVTDAIWYMLKDSPTCNYRYDCKSGVYRADGSPKPARDVLRNWQPPAAPTPVPTPTPTPEPVPVPPLADRVTLRLEKLPYRVRVYGYARGCERVRITIRRGTGLRYVYKGVTNNRYSGKVLLRPGLNRLRARCGDAASRVKRITI